MDGVKPPPRPKSDGKIDNGSPSTALTILQGMAPLQIPGYHFDGKKYYKILKGGGTPIIPTAPVVAHDPTPRLSASEHRRKKRRTKEKGKEKAVEPSASILRGMFDGHLSQGERSRWKQYVMNPLFILHLLLISSS